MVWPVAICFKLLQSDFSTARSDALAVSVSSVKSNATYPIRFAVFISALLTLEYAAPWMAGKRQGTTSFLSGEMTQFVVSKTSESEKPGQHIEFQKRFLEAQNRREMYSRIWCFQYGQSWPPSGPQLSREWRIPFAARISGRREEGAEFSHWPVPVAMRISQEAGSPRGPGSL